MEQNPHIAILQSPGMGHLIPHMEFAKKLIFHHNFSVTLIIPTDRPLSDSQKHFLETLPRGMNYILLEPVNCDDISDEARPETRICVTLVRSLPSLRDAIKSLLSTTKLVAMVVDGLGTDAFDIAREFNVSFYIFFTSPALCFSFVYHLPNLDREVDCEFRDLSEPIRLPGCIPIKGKELFDAANDRKNEAYKWILHHAERYKLAEGILLNTFKQLEEETIKALQVPAPGKPEIYTFGPLIQSGDKEEDGSECLKWLDQQPTSSVVFVSFGSGGTLSHDQIIELALGLELSEQRFMWVVRCPNDKSSSAAFFGIKNQDDPLAFLPEGFVDRIKNKNRGFLLPSWAPQAEILRHGSISCFVTHCGWNSILESVVSGKPLIAWPLYAEQKMNALMLTEELKVAIRPKNGENGLVERIEIAKALKDVMEGEDGKGVRSRMEILREAAAEAVSENGSSTQCIAQLASKWKDKVCA